MTNLIINFASRGRPQQFLKSLQNITDSISTNDYRILISADFDDVEMNNLSMLEKILGYPNTEIYYGEPTSKVGAINRTAKYFGNFHWLINHSDDMAYVVNEWDVEMLNKITSVWGDSTDFFAHFSDGHVHDKLPTLNICGYDYFQRDKEIYHNSYGSVSCDAENFFKAKMRGRHHYFPEVYFHHVHPANIPSIKIDQTYRGNDKWGDRDTANYFERMSHGFYVENPVFMPDEVKLYMDKRLQNEQK